MLFEGFESRRVVLRHTTLQVRLGGSGPALLLVHGYPQSHVMWHRVAAKLATNFTLVMPDLRGYGDSDAVASKQGIGYSKRVMAQDLVELMAQLGYAKFRVAGHDRGGRVAYRLALDHDCVEQLAVLDIIPTLEQFERMGQAGSVSSYHWYFLAQPDPFPEKLIAADPGYFLRHTVSSWWGCQNSVVDDAAMAQYQRCFEKPQVIHATCEDYRAGATIDCENDAHDRSTGHKIDCPLLALWGNGGRAAQRGDLLDVWRGWARDVRGEGVDCGHFLAEEQPDITSKLMLDFFS